MDEEYLKDEEYPKYITEEWLKTICDALHKIVKDQLGEMQFLLV